MTTPMIPRSEAEAMAAAALDMAAQAAYRVCAETRHVTLGRSAEAAILSLTPADAARALEARIAAVREQAEKVADDTPRSIVTTNNNFLRLGADAVKKHIKRAIRAQAAADPTGARALEEARWVKIKPLVWELRAGTDGPYYSAFDSMCGRVVEAPDEETCDAINRNREASIRAALEE